MRTTTWLGLLACAVLLTITTTMVARAGTEYAPGPITDAYVRSNALHVASSPATATTTEVIAAPGAGLRIVIIHGFAQSEGTQDLTLLSGSTAMTAATEFADGDYRQYDEYRLSQNEAFNITTTGAVQLNTDWTYVIVKE